MIRLVDPNNGVLPSQWIRQAAACGTILSDIPVTPQQIQPNSLDLRLGDCGFRVQCSFLPGVEGMAGKLDRYRWYTFDIPDDGILLERNQVYIFPLQESLVLSPEVSGRANPKSTTGRLDIFTRLVTERSTAFDEVSAGYHGKLYLEVIPRSFAVRIRKGDTLSQVRFQVGSPVLSYAETMAMLDEDSLILDSDLRVLRSSDLPVHDGIVLSVNLPRAQQQTVGYQARRNTPPVDLRATGLPKRRYWDRIHADSKPVILEPDEFYIFRSRELICLPPECCAEMVAFEARSGEVRTHYAGFFDSGFGYSSSASPTETAAGVVLEVRSRDVPFLIEDGQPIFRINLLRCTEVPDALYGSRAGSNYQGQRDVRLSRQFSVSDVHEERPDSTQIPLEI